MPKQSGIKVNKDHIIKSQTDWRENNECFDTDYRGGRSTVRRKVPFPNSRRKGNNGICGVSAENFEALKGGVLK